MLSTKVVRPGSIRAPFSLVAGANNCDHTGAERQAGALKPAHIGREAKLLIYLDHHAHTPLDPRVRDVLMQAFCDHDTNVHAMASVDAQAALEVARGQVADLVGVSAGEIVFVSGATEANNLALLGLKEQLLRKGRTRIIVSAGEHSSVLAAAAALGDSFNILQVPLLPGGEVDITALDRLVTPETGLISIAAANHEIGTIQSLSTISQIAAERGAILHSDLAQAAGKIPLSLNGVQLASISAHKIHGPLGIGALVAQRPVRRVMRPLIHGGGQEAGLRSGTLPVPLCIAFGEACAIAARDLHRTLTFSTSSCLPRTADVHAA